MWIDTLEFAVGDERGACSTLVDGFGFGVVEHRHRMTSVRCGDVTVVVRGGYPDDAVRDVVLGCTHPAAVAERARAAGLTVSGPPAAPTVHLLGDGTIRHTLRSADPRPSPATGSGVQGIDHVAYCLPIGMGERVAATYEHVFGLERVHVGAAEEVSAFGAGMRSTVLRAGSGSNLTIVLTEPLTEGAGQIQRFVDAHGGPALQHAALAVPRLTDTAEMLRAAGVAFLPVPEGYYGAARRRLRGHDLDWDALARLDVLVDDEGDGLLLQMFTRPVLGDGFFFELIQRRGAAGFGANNVRALFAAVEAAESLSGGRER